MYFGHFQYQWLSMFVISFPICDLLANILWSCNNSNDLPGRGSCDNVYNKLSGGLWSYSCLYCCAWLREVGGGRYFPSRLMAWRVGVGRRRTIFFTLLIWDLTNTVGRDTKSRSHPNNNVVLPPPPPLQPGTEGEARVGPESSGEFIICHCRMILFQVGHWNFYGTKEYWQGDPIWEIIWPTY